MKRILVIVALTGMLIPGFASAELNYNAVDAGYSTSYYKDNKPNLFQFSLGLSRNVFRNVYLATSYGIATQQTFSATNDEKIKSISLGAGYHTPLRDTLKIKIDGIVKGNIVLDRGNFAGNSVSAHGYDIGAGVRAQFAHGLEGSLALVHASQPTGSTTYSSTFIDARLGFYFIPKIQMNAGIGMGGNSQTINMGLRFFY